MKNESVIKEVFMPSYTLTINNVQHTVAAEADTPLLWVLRDNLDLTGTKYGCGIGSCGACTVQFNGNAVRACMLNIAAAAEGEIITIEGISESTDHPLQQAWKELDVPQCGYCQSGQIMSALSLLSKNTRPSDEEINTAMQGNICRCGTYNRVRDAIQLAGSKMEE